jgi:hypothetical protein
VIRAYHWEDEEVLAHDGGELEGAALLLCGGGEWRVPAPFVISDDDAIALVRGVARHFQENCHELGVRWRSCSRLRVVSRDGIGKV